MKQALQVSLIINLHDSQEPRVPFHTMSGHAEKTPEPENGFVKRPTLDEDGLPPGAAAIKRRIIRPKKLRKVEDNDLPSTPGAGPSSPRNSPPPSRSRPVSPSNGPLPTKTGIATSMASPPIQTKRPPPPRSYLTPARPAHPPLISCRSVYSYTRLNHIEEGTYGVVFRARCNDTGGIYALKKLKLEEEKQGFPITSLREVMALMVAGGHENVVGIREIVVGDTLNQYVQRDRLDGHSDDKVEQH